MKITLLCVGKLKERHYREACDEYLKRIRKYLPCEVIEVKQASGLGSRRPARTELWCLTERGQPMTTPELAHAIEQRMIHGCPGITFVLGGAEGLPGALEAGADRQLALSRLTLAHRLARLVLLEQLYRVMSLIKGEPYHR